MSENGSSLIPNNDKALLMHGVSDRFSHASRAAIYESVPVSLWQDWRWQHQNRIRTLDQLRKVISLSSEEEKTFVACNEKFKVAITPYYASLMDSNNTQCPIRLQSVPTTEELIEGKFDLDDPLGEEKDMPVPGITHRYPDRVLFYVTHHCPVYCRHCTRKRKVSDPRSMPGPETLEAGLQYIRDHTEIRDVLVSGGDPLSLSDDRLEWIFSQIRAIPHVEMIRLCTRNPVTLPFRVTEELAVKLKRFHPIYVHTHFNHPKECTVEAFQACAILADHGFVLNNQTVLLKGVNDNADLMKELNHKLLMMRVKPYYLLQADLARGISHFRTPVEIGIQIIDKLRGWTSGVAVPHYVIDSPGGGGKVSIVPPWITGSKAGALQITNYRGEKYEYPER